VIRVTVRPQMLRWARERAGYSAATLAGRFPKLAVWESGELQPTLKQLERFAKATHVPVGFLFLPDPPEERVPIPDFRTVAGARGSAPSPSLLDTIYLCQQRQEWFRDFARSMGESPLEFVSSSTVTDDVEVAASRIGTLLGFNVEARRKIPTWTEAFRQFIAQAEAAGVLVMCSGIVGNNTHRPLDPDEFRGFALADDLAPLLFVNGADTKAAQMFTVAHELAHIWLGQSAVTDSEAGRIPDDTMERWCNRVAAELLAPIGLVQAEYDADAPLEDETRRLARRFKVSTLVILRRIHDAGGITREALWAEYAAEVERLRAFPRGSGGNFYLTQAARTSRRFTRALVISTMEGRTLHRDAYRLLGFSKLSTFQELGRTLGVAI
jgi:Zn-dependent peptidase ImmA (M78 family)/transcriptional regulator with XRE-family HTH domain